MSYIKKEDALNAIMSVLDDPYYDDNPLSLAYSRIDKLQTVEVPTPHGDLIDRDALMKTCGMATDCYDCPNGEHGWCKRSQDAANICEAIEDAPTVIEAVEANGCD